MSTNLREAVSGWEDEGGAGPSDRSRSTTREPAGDAARTPQRDGLDKSHDSGTRGEHRYPDDHQTDAEQDAREERDALKRKLGEPSSGASAAGRRERAK